MSVKSDFTYYRDGSDLMAPNPLPEGTFLGSDNGPMFTAEYYIILKDNNELTFLDRCDFERTIENCISNQGLLNRYPISSVPQSQEQADDYYGVLNGCMQLGQVLIPRQFLKSTLRYLGFLNNVDPGRKTIDSFLIRQPQLVAAIVAASYPSLVNPLHYVARLLAFPFFFIAALSILVSCMLSPKQDTDARRLSWHLVKITKPVSILCKVASIVWYRRLYKDYGPTGMKAVAAIYYKPQGDNPYSKYWVS